MKIVSLILIVSAFPAVAQVASPSDGKPRGNASRRGQNAAPAQVVVQEPAKKKGFFSSIKDAFKPGRSQRRVLVVPKQEQSQEPPKRTASSKPKEPKRPAASAPSTPSGAGENTAPAPANPTLTSAPVATAAVAATAATIVPAAATGDATTPTAALPPAASEPAPAAAVEFNRERYLEAKRNAAQDPKVEALAQKLGTAKPGKAYQTAAKNYTKALFSKIREVDASQNEWIDRLEAATNRRIEAGKAIVID